MQPNTRCFLSAALLLATVFVAVYLRVAYPPDLKPVVVRQWATTRPLVPDSVLYDFVRQVVAQSDPEPPRPFSKHKAAFWISRVLFEHAPVMLNAPHGGGRFFQYRYGEESAPILEQLYAEQILSAADTAFMRQQIARSADFRLESRFLPDCKIIPVELLRRHMKRPGMPDADFFTAMDHLKREYRTQHVSFLSAPLFSCDGRCAVTTVTLNLGTFCGVGNRLTLVMQRKQGQWLPLQSITN
ncbi:hypothetical protein [Hymenobacter sp. UYP22]|uniref:hypothetical protein n=1 Tax=Hymenobacter sp. UYP22 TaxID=3156348 RepID=UPI0033959C5F